MSMVPYPRNGRGGPKRGGVGSGGRGGKRGGWNDLVRDNHPHSPDRQSVHSAEGFRVPRRSHMDYRQPNEPMSRTPSRESRREDHPVRDYRRRDVRNDERRGSFDDDRAPSPHHQKSKNKGMGEWELRLGDADEDVRRAEYDLRRAKMVRENVRASYAEYVKNL
uniref:Piwi domain-containing protein n=1 Tax=Caenorhabditis japonica TaxID=281687 RepID=A0A8R1IMZ2_CAEJA